MNIFPYVFISFFFSILFPTRATKNATDPSKVKEVIKKTMEIDGVQLNVKTAFSMKHYNYAIVEKYRERSCYHICGRRGFVEASGFYNFMAFERGYLSIELDNVTGCLNNYEVDGDYSLFKGNSKYCFCVRPTIQNYIYAVEGFTELYFPRSIRYANETPFYNESLDQMDVYFVRSPCEQSKCSVRVDPYLVSTRNFTNQTVTVGKELLEDDLAVAQEAVVQIQWELNEYLRNYDVLEKDRDKILEKLANVKEVESQLRAELKEQIQVWNNLTESVHDIRVGSQVVVEVQALKEEIEKLQGVEEVNRRLTNQLQNFEIDMQFLQNEKDVLEVEKNRYIKDIETLKEQMETLHQEIERLKTDLETYETDVEELDAIKLDYEITRRKLEDVERSREQLEKELKRSQAAEEMLEAKSVDFEKTLEKSNLAIEQLERAIKDNFHLKKRITVLSDEKKSMEEEQLLTKNILSEIQREGKEVNLKLKLCSERVEALRYESDEKMGELELTKHNETYWLKTQFESTVNLLEGEIRLGKEELNRSHALVSKLKKDKEQGEENLQKVQEELSQLVIENNELKHELEEASMISGQVSKLQLEVDRLQTTLRSLKDENKLLEEEKVLRQDRLNQLTGNYNMLKKENEMKTQALKELEGTQLELKRTKEDIFGKDEEKRLLEAKINLSENQKLSLEKEIDRLRIEIQEKIHESIEQNKVIVNVMQIQSELAAIKAEKAKTMDELSNARAKLVQLENENEGLKRDLETKKELNDKISSLEMEISQIHDALIGLEMKKNQTEEALKIAQDEAQRLEEQNNDMKSALERNGLLENQLDLTKQAMESVQNRLKEIEKEKTVTQTKLNSMEAQYNDMKKELTVKATVVHELQSTKAELDRVQEKLTDLNDQKRNTEEKLIQVQFDLTKLETKNNELNASTGVSKHTLEDLSNLDKEDSITATENYEYALEQDDEITMNDSPQETVVPRTDEKLTQAPVDNEMKLQQRWGPEGEETEHANQHASSNKSNSDEDRKGKKVEEKVKNGMKEIPSGDELPRTSESLKAKEAQDPTKDKEEWDLMKIHSNGQTYPNSDDSGKKSELDQATKAIVDPTTTVIKDGEFTNADEIPHEKSREDEESTSYSEVMGYRAPQGTPCPYETTLPNAETYSPCHSPNKSLDETLSKDPVNINPGSHPGHNVKFKDTTNFMSTAASNPDDEDESASASSMHNFDRTLFAVFAILAAFI